MREGRSGAAAPKLLLQNDGVSSDTLSLLETLVAGVRSGAVVGVVVGVVLRRRRYMVHVCGDALRDPTYARGVTAAIDDELRELIHEHAQRSSSL